jgi:hypothetical protein
MDLLLVGYGRHVRLDKRHAASGGKDQLLSLNLKHFHGLFISKRSCAHGFATLTSEVNHVGARVTTDRNSVTRAKAESSDFPHRSRFSPFPLVQTSVMVSEEGWRNAGSAAYPRGLRE